MRLNLLLHFSLGPKTHERNHSAQSKAPDDDDGNNDQTGNDNSEDSFDVRIYAATTSSIKDAKKMLNDKAKSEWKQSDINDPQINALNKYQVTLWA